jgi:hypothetical protein
MAVAVRNSFWKCTNLIHFFKICIKEVYLLKPPQIDMTPTIFNQLNIMVPYVDIIGRIYSVAILGEIYVMQPKCNVR